MRNNIQHHCCGEFQYFAFLKRAISLYWKKEEEEGENEREKRESEESVRGEREPGMKKKEKEASWEKWKEKRKE